MEAATPSTAYEPPAGVPRLASWWRRFGALLIDNIIVLTPAAVGIVLIIVGDDGGGAEPLSLLGLFLLLFAITVGQGLYFTILHGRNGQTLGKRALRIRVIDEQAGGTIGYGRAFGRWVVPWLVNALCGFFSILDGLWPLWDDRNQALHDKVAKSVVVRVSN